MRDNDTISTSEKTNKRISANGVGQFAHTAHKSNHSKLKFAVWERTTPSLFDSRQYSTVQSVLNKANREHPKIEKPLDFTHNTVQYSRYATVLYSIQYSTILHSTLSSTMQCSTIQYPTPNSMQYCTVLYRSVVVYGE